MPQNGHRSGADLGTPQVETIEARIRAATPGLTKGGRKVAAILLAAYPIAGLESEAQLADRAGVSAPTVTRFVVALGFGGFKDFQDRLRQEVQHRLTVQSGTTVRPMRPDEVLRSSHRAFVRSLDATFESSDPGELAGVVDLLMDPRHRVLFTGGRFSQILAFYLFGLVDRLRPDCCYINAEPTLRMRDLSSALPDDILVVFDFYPYQLSTVEFARRAAERRLSLVLFTDPWLSPIAAQARRVLTASLESPSLSGSLVAAIAIVETVAAGLAARLDVEARLRIEEEERRRAVTVGAQPTFDMGGTGWRRDETLGPGRP